jgi:hypothetical protein
MRHKNLDLLRVLKTGISDFLEKKKPVDVRAFLF